MSASLPRAGFILSAANARLRRDPLSIFHFISEAQRKLIRYIAQGYETLFRAGNGTGKTFIGAAAAMAMLRGMRELAGEKLPHIPTPCVGWCIVQTYKGQVDGAQAAILHWLGDWPHKIVWVKSEAQGWIDTLWVATDRCTHGTDEKCRSCSKLVFHCSESSSSVGGRVDFVWADEPPDKDIWDEARQHGRAKNLLVRYITATPKEKVWWWWMPSDFNECTDKPNNGFIEIRSSMMDNTALSNEVLKQKLGAAAKDQRSRAVIYGDYVDLKGECPFPPDKLEEWLAKCRKPELEEVVVTTERRTADGNVTIQVTCSVEIFAPYDPTESYVGVLDPATFLRLHSKTGLVAADWEREGSSSRGVPDPCGLHIYSRRKPMLVARFSGYSAAYGLGSLGAFLGKRYGNALIDIDLTGGHGEPCVRALIDAGYRNLNAYNQKASDMHMGMVRFGFTMNAGNRAEMVSSIQQALLGNSLICESETCVRSLMAVTYVMTSTGKERPEASYGSHDEDMICMGRALHLMQSLPTPSQRSKTPQEKIEELLGRPLVGLPRPRNGKIGRVLWNPTR